MWLLLLLFVAVVIVVDIIVVGLVDDVMLLSIVTIDKEDVDEEAEVSEDVIGWVDESNVVENVSVSVVDSNDIVGDDNNNVVVDDKDDDDDDKVGVIELEVVFVVVVILPVVVVVVVVAIVDDVVEIGFFRSHSTTSCKQSKLNFAPIVDVAVAVEKLSAANRTAIELSSSGSKLSSIGPRSL